MQCRQSARLATVCACVLFGTRTAVMAQDPAPGPPPHDHAHMNMGTASGWQFMQDGILFVEGNHAGGSRGGNEVVAPN